jgi:hypothetical protein
MVQGCGCAFGHPRLAGEWTSMTNETRDPHEMARESLTKYVGDIDFINEGGAWYNTEHWGEDGYADCVRVTPLTTEATTGGRIINVERITVNKPRTIGELTRALDSCGCGADTPYSMRADAQIEACLGFGYYDPNCSDYAKPQSKMFLIRYGGNGPPGVNVTFDMGTLVAGTEEDVFDLIHQWVVADGCD